MWSRSFAERGWDTTMHQENRTAEFAVMLRLNPLFSSLDPAVIDVLSRCCATRTLEAGAFLFQKGDAGDALYGIRRGQVTVETGSADGRRIVLAALGSGDLFGEIAMLDGLSRTADVVATETSELFVLRRPDLLAMIAREPSMALKLIEIVCKRLRAVVDQLEQVMTLKLDARLARCLIGLAEDFGGEVVISQEELARHVGASRESVNRQLQTWQGSDWLVVGRGRVTLKRADALRAVAKLPA